MSEESEKTTSGVDLAYEIAVASYDMAVRRLDSVDSRIQNVVSFAVSASAVVFSVTAGRLTFRSFWFYSALISLLASVGVGIYARWTGDIWLGSQTCSTNDGFTRVLPSSRKILSISLVSTSSTT